MTETRQERFKRLAEKRTNSILEQLRILGNLSNRANYDYSEEEIKKIFSVIENQLREVKIRFSNRRKINFTL